MKAGLKIPTYGKSYVAGQLIFPKSVLTFIVELMLQL
jgi:FKBP-type peptidyl-prolyl cis-trans isomerase